MLGTALAGAAVLRTPFLDLPALAAEPHNIYGTSVTIRGNPFPLSTFANKVLVVVNIASK